MEDTDFEVEINSDARRGHYVARVIRAPSGGNPSASFDLDVEAIVCRREDLENAILASSIPARRAIPATEKSLHEVGTRLFRAVFDGLVNSAYRASLGAAQHSGNRLRVVLRLSAPELAALPWEMLFDPETESYLCRKAPLVRRIPAPDYAPAPLDLVPPLRILCVVASPRDLVALDTEEEMRHLAQALSSQTDNGRIEIAWVPQATWQEVQDHLLSGTWHVLHFIGHGDYDTEKNEGCIALVGDDGRADMIESSRLTDLLDEADPTPRLVILNSCSSGRAAADDLFAGTAAALARGGIHAVAAMQFTISDIAAIKFSRGFYTALAAGRDIDRAIVSGRKAILGLPGTLEWVTPVLYIRGSSAQIFELKGVAPPRQRQIRLGELYAGARAAFAAGRHDTTTRLLDEILDIDPNYRDARALRAHVEAQRRNRQRAKLEPRRDSAQGTSPARRVADERRPHSVVGSDSGLRSLACALAVLAALLLTVNPFVRFASDSGDTVAKNTPHMVLPVLAMAVLTATAGIVVGAFPQRRLTGLGLLLGSGAVLPWFLLTQWISPSSAPHPWSQWGTGTWVFIVGILSWMLAAGVAGVALVRSRAVHVQARYLVRNGSSLTVLILGGIAFVALVAHHFAFPLDKDDVPRAYPELGAVWVSASALLIPVTAAASNPRQFRTALLAGWIGSCGAFLYYAYERALADPVSTANIGALTIFTGALLIIAIVAARRVP